MHRYSPLWSNVVDSSLWCEPDFVVKVFLTMIAKKDLDDIVRGTAFNIAQWAKKTEAEVLQAIEILSAPDKRRVEKQPFDGRRIEKCDEGYRVLNGGYYRQKMTEAHTRARKAKWQAEYRKRKKQGPPIPGEQEYVNAVNAGATQEQQDSIVTRHLPPPAE